MSNPFDTTAVQQVAHLARLKISAEETANYARQLADVLAHIQQLNEVNTHDVPPTAHPHDLTNVLRTDSLQPSSSAEDALKNAPQRQDEFFRVPKVLDQETA